jgi:mannose-1-phosphate guanylyltransferase
MIPSARRERPSASRELHALVLAGGFGRRLEPVTRRLFGAAVPKQFCRFGSRRSLLQQTIDRLAPLVPAARVTVVVDRSQSAIARQQLSGSPGLRLIEQPCDRGTAAGVLLPLLDLLARAPGAKVLLAPSDHGVAREDLLLSRIRAAARAVAADPGRLVLLGAEPQAANRDYGWIVYAGLADPAESVDDVERFVEKPRREEAELLFASGRALWNTMVMVAEGAALLRVLRERAPALFRGMEALLSGARRTGRLFPEEYAKLPVVNFSADVIGSAEGLGVVSLPRLAGWTDLGTEARLVKWLRASRRCGAELARSA